MKSLWILALFATSASAQVATTEAYSIDSVDTISHDDKSPYDIASGGLELQYSHTSDGVVNVSASVRMEHHDDPFGDTRVYFDNLYVSATANGACDVLGKVGVMVSEHLKLDVGNQEIEPSSLPPPVDDVHAFDGGTVTFNHQEVGSNAIAVTGIVLAFDSGETHRYGYASAAYSCPVPVELLRFEVE